MGKREEKAGRQTEEGKETDKGRREEEGSGRADIDDDEMEEGLAGD